MFIVYLTNKERTPLHCITIGNFDGFHKGHQALCHKTLECAHKLRTHVQSQAQVLTFLPHPKDFFKKENKKRRWLLPPEWRKGAVTELGLDACLVEPFTEAFSKMTAEDFVMKYLKIQRKCSVVIIGSNFRFGYGGEGGPEVLKRWGDQAGIQVYVMDPSEGQLTFRGAPVSSTRIRGDLVQRGDMESVNGQLGRPYMIAGEVVQGDKLGRQLGFPTANLKDHDFLWPAYGVYAGFAALEPEDQVLPVMSIPPHAWPAVANVGIRPSIKKGHEERFEVHILKNNESDKWKFDPLYGKKMAFYLISRIRGEAKFENLEALTHQIYKDCIAAGQILEAYQERV